jgi:hypothetical protein
MTSRLFDLKTSVDELSSNEGIVKMDMQRVLPNRTISQLSDLTGGQVVFRFGQTASNKWIVNNQCYLEAFCDFTVAGGGRPAVANLIAPCMDTLSTLFQSIEVQINNKRVSYVDSFVAQCDIFLKRVMHNDAFLKSAQLEYIASFGDRVSSVSSNGLVLHTALGKVIIASNATIDVNLVGANTGNVDAPEPSLRANSVNIKWYPSCVSFFGVDHATPASGDFQLILQPFQTNVELRACETGVTSNAGASPYPVFNITNLYLNVPYITGPAVNNMEFLLDFDSVRCDSRILTSNAFQSSTFDVPSSTYACGVAFQASSQYNATQTNGNPSSTVFKAHQYNKGTPYASEEMTLKRLYIQYDDNVYPNVDMNLAFDSANGLNRLGQLYDYTMQQSDAVNDQAGMESYENWLSRGLYMYVNLPKPASSSCTRVVVNTEFNTLTASSTNVLLFSRYRQVVKCVIKDGRYVDIVQSDN